MPKITCEICEGTGDTHGNHVENCDIEVGCVLCESNEVCEDCGGAGFIHGDEDDENQEEDE